MFAHKCLYASMAMMYGSALSIACKNVVNIMCMHSTVIRPAGISIEPFFCFSIFSCIVCIISSIISADFFLFGIFTWGIPI